MKWLTLLVGALIIIAGGWLLLSPQSADGPAEPPAFDETVEGQGDAMEKEDGDAMMKKDGAMMEDGTVDEGAMEKKMEADDHNTTRSNKTESAAGEEPQGDPIFHALVDYTDSGYSPATVTINKGETVRFVNSSSRGNWVGGDNHPTHTIYPEKSSTDCLGTSFDTCRSLQAGEFWEFTFNHAGSWGYHNHVRARDGGTIVVQ